MKTTIFPLSIFLLSLGLCLNQLYGQRSSVVAPYQQDNGRWEPVLSGLTSFFQFGTEVSAIDDNGHIYIAGRLKIDNKYIIKIVKWDGTQWSFINGYLDNNAPTQFINESVNALAVDASGNIYVAGLFTNARNSDSGPDIQVNNVAKWEQAAQQWSPIGLSFTSFDINAITADANGNIYIGMTQTYSALNPDSSYVSGSAIVKWDETAQAWDNMRNGLRPLPGSFSFGVEDMEILNNDIYVTGSFGEATDATGNTISVQALARWDGSGWNEVDVQAAGPGADFGKSIEADSQGNIYISTDDAQFILKYNGNSWNDISPDPKFSGTLAIDNSDTVYIQHITSNGKYAVSKFDGNEWIKQVEILNGQPKTFSGNPLASQNAVFLGGLFPQLKTFPDKNNLYYRNNAYWDGNQWNKLTSPPNGDTIFAVQSEDFSNSFFLGGNFENLGGLRSPYIGYFQDGGLVSMGNGLDSTVYAIATRNSDFDSIVYFGGLFTEAYDTLGNVVANTSYITAWNKNSNTFLPIGRGLNGPVYDILFIRPATWRDPFGYLVVGGDFTEAINADGSVVNAQHLVGFNFQTGLWEKLGNTDGPVKALTHAWESNELVIGGNFSTLTTNDGEVKEMNYIALFNRPSSIPDLNTGGSWHNLGKGTDGEVLTLLSISSIGGFHTILVGGRFQVVRNGDKTIRSPYFAQFNRLSYIDDPATPGNLDSLPSSWSRPAYGYGELDGPVHHISGSDIYTAIVSGEFTKARMWDGSVRELNHITQMKGIIDVDGRPHLNYQQLGTGTNEPIYDHAGIHACEELGIVAGGIFTEAGNQNAGSLAKWKFPERAQSVVGFAKPTTNGFMSREVISLCFNPHKKAPLKQIFALAQEEVPVEKFNMETYTPFNLHYLNASDISDTLTSFHDLMVTDENRLYTIVGVYDTTEYAPNPDNISIALGLISSNTEFWSKEESVGIKFIHTSTDAPAMDIITKHNDTLAHDLHYAEQADYLELKKQVYPIDFVESKTGTLIFSDSIDLSGMQNQVLVYYITGFVDPELNQGGSAIGGNFIDFDIALNIDSSVNLQQQEIMFAEIPDKFLDDANFTVSATSSQNLPVSFEIINGAVSIKRNLVTIDDAGEVTVRAYQPGNDTVNSAEAFQTFCVLPQQPVLKNVGDSILISSAETGNQWYRNDTALSGETNDTLYIMKSGDYKTALNVQGCSSFSDELNITMVPTSIRENLTGKIAIHPNPADNEISVSIPSTKKSVMLKIFDARGTLVFSKQTLGSTKIDISSFDSGFYIVKAGNDQWQEIAGIMVE
jgi:hypothetical protein